jgi:hypothetical protein
MNRNFYEKNKNFLINVTWQKEKRLASFRLGSSSGSSSSSSASFFTQCVQIHMSKI